MWSAVFQCLLHVTRWQDNPHTHMHTHYHVLSIAESRLCTCVVCTCVADRIENMRREIGVASFTSGVDQVQLHDLLGEGTYGKVFKGECVCVCVCPNSSCGGFGSGCTNAGCCGDENDVGKCGRYQATELPSSYLYVGG